MGVDEAVMVAAGNAALEPGQLQMAAWPIDALLRHAGNGAVGRTAADFGRSDLDDAADDVLDSSRIDTGNVVGPAINAIDDEGQVFAELVGEMLVDDAADDRRRGRAVVNPEARRIAREALRLQRPVHRLDDVAALAQFAQGRLQFFAQLPAARRGLAGESHPLQLAQSRQPQRAVGDAARISRRVPEVHETLAGLGDQRPVDAGEAVLINLGRELPPLLDFGDRTEFEGDQLACPLANAMGDVIAIDDQILAQLISAVDDDMNMGMTGIKMVRRDPIELRSQVGFEFAHEVAGEAGQVSELRAVLRRDDDAKLVAVVLTAIEEGISPTMLHGEVIAPALRRIDEMAHAGELDPDRRQLAQGITRRVLATLYRYMLAGSDATRERVLVAGLEGDEHQLELQMMHDQLSAAGYRTIHDPNIARGALATTIERHGPDAVLLGAAPRASEEELEAAVRDARASHPGIPIVLGGAVAGGALPPEHEGLRVLERIDEAVQAVEEQLADRVPAAPAASR